MPQKQNASPKLKRAEKTPKKGAVRQHAKKRGPAQLPQGGDVLTQVREDRKQAKVDYVAPKPKKVYATNPLWAAPQVAKYVGTAMVELASQKNWSQVTRSLVWKYIVSLTEGDGSRSEELNRTVASKVETAFVGACFEHQVAWDVLPGQRTGWYRKRTEKCRNRRS